MSGVGATITSLAPTGPGDPWSGRRPHVVVLGAGLAGVTTAHVLLRSGARVTVVAAGFGWQTGGTVVSPLWEWPVHDIVPAQRDPGADRAGPRLDRWAADSYRTLLAMSLDPRSGVTRRDVTTHLDVPLLPRSPAGRRVHAMRRAVRDFRHDPYLVGESGLDPGAGFVDAYQHLAPVVDVAVHLLWLTADLVESGAGIIRCRIGPEDVGPAAGDLGADVVVNCTGMGARELADDRSTTLVRHTWWLLRNAVPGLPVVASGHRLSLAAHHAGGEQLLVVPHDRGLVVGRAAGAQGDGSSGHELERAAQLLPWLARRHRMSPARVRTGVRTHRLGGARVERVERVDGPVPIVHNYGHGVSAVSTSWGAARAAARLALTPVGAGALRRGRG